MQNMLLAPRALGLGATLYLHFETEAEAALGLPPGVHSYALLVWASSPYRAHRCRLRKSVGSALPRLSLAAMRWAAAHLAGQLILALAQIDDMA